MESQLSRIKGQNEETVTENFSRSENDPNVRSGDHVDNGQQAVTQLNFEEVLLNNNNVTPRQVGQILRCLGDEINDFFKVPVRSSKNGWTVDD